MVCEPWTQNIFYLFSSLHWETRIKLIKYLSGFKGASFMMALPLGDAHEHSVIIFPRDNFF